MKRAEFGDRLWHRRYINYIAKGEKYALDPLMDVYISQHKMPDDVICKKGVGESLPFDSNLF